MLFWMTLEDNLMHLCMFTLFIMMSRYLIIFLRMQPQAWKYFLKILVCTVCRREEANEVVSQTVAARTQEHSTVKMGPSSSHRSRGSHHYRMCSESALLVHIMRSRACEIGGGSDLERDSSYFNRPSSVGGLSEPLISQIANSDQ